MRMDSLGRHLILFTMLLVLGMKMAVAQYPMQYVIIHNYLPGKQDLTIHCKSGDDDIGGRMLRYGGSYKFNFHPNIWGTTLFFCFFGWTGQYHYYDIYIQDRDQRRCGVCSWAILPQGPCLLNPNTGTYDLCDHWNPPAMS